MDWTHWIFGLGLFAVGWCLGWVMGIARTVVIYKSLRRDDLLPDEWK